MKSFYFSKCALESPLILKQNMEKNKKDNSNLGKGNQNYCSKYNLYCILVLFPNSVDLCSKK